MKPARILIAEDDSMMPLVVAALDGYHLVEAYTFEQAKRMILEDGIDLVVIGIQFDESRVIELITYIRLNREHEKIPVIVHRLCPSEHAGILRTSLRALKSLRFVNDYLELENDPDAERLIRDAVELELARLALMQY